MEVDVGYLGMHGCDLRWTLGGSAKAAVASTLPAPTADCSCEQQVHLRNEVPVATKKTLDRSRTRRLSPSLWTWCERPHASPPRPHPRRPPLPHRLLRTRELII